MLKVTDMVRRSTRSDERERATADQATSIAPADRIAQRGPRACQQILTMTAAGIPNSRPCVVQNLLRFGADDWSIGIWNQHTAGSFCLGCFADKADHEEASKLFNKAMLEQW